MNVPVNTSAIPTSGLLRLHKAFWYLVMAWFAVVCVFFPINADLATEFAFWGVVFVLLMNVARLLFLTELFRRAGQRRYVWLGLLLLFVLCATILYKYFV